MPGYLPPFLTVPAEIGEVFRTWRIPWQCNRAGDRDLLLLSCVQRESRRCLIVEDVGGEKELGVLSSESRSVSGLGPRLSPRGCI